MLTVAADAFWVGAVEWQTSKKLGGHTTTLAGIP